MQFGVQTHPGPRKVEHWWWGCWLRGLGGFKYFACKWKDLVFSAFSCLQPVVIIAFVCANLICVSVFGRKFIVWSIFHSWMHFVLYSSRRTFTRECGPKRQSSWKFWTVLDRSRKLSKRRQFRELIWQNLCYCNWRINCWWSQQERLNLVGLKKINFVDQLF